MEISVTLWKFLLTAKLELDIEEYSFSQTTLEQVFLKFSHYDEGNSVEWWFVVLMCHYYVIIGDVNSRISVRGRSGFEWRMFLIAEFWEQDLRCFR